LGTRERGRLLGKPLPQRGPLHRVTPIKTGGARGKERKVEKGKGGLREERKSARKSGERQLGTCTEPNAETDVLGETPPNGAYGASKPCFAKQQT